MTLSVIIVNYNVQYFLDQCLQSVFIVAQDIETEVWVVDNNSVDGSVAMVREKYPQVHLIANKDNPGFAKANNQALVQASGKYMLLLNPDTVVERDTFTKCIDFMESHPDCGGLGVKMINGDGVYLKESKRGFPSPLTSFFKISGLIRLFPHHKTIAAYYMGHLSDDETNEIEVLPGAYLMISKVALDKVGLLDETYFMYGEDIDFSWRIRLAGFKNYYLPSARIIHYKGESTKKGSMNYVYTFYNAMVIFTKRYFSGNNATLFIMLIKLAIWSRASLAFIQRMLKKIAVPLLDFATAFGGFMLIKSLWATFRAENINYYPPEYTWIVIPIYVLILMLGAWLYGGYDKPVKPARTIKGMAIGALLLLVFYSMLNETMRYSRAVIVLGSIWTILSTLGLRGLFSLCGVKGYFQFSHQHSQLIVGSMEETTRVLGLMESLGIEPSYIGMVSNTTENQDDHYYVGHLDQLPELIHYYKVDEVIFCGKDIPSEDIISQMAKLKTTGVEYKIVPDEGDYIIGSNAINSKEDLFSIELDTIATPLNRRNKRLFDISTSLMLMVMSPIMIWLQHHKRHYLWHCMEVLVGRRSWVGYHPESDTETLPKIKPGVFTPCHITHNPSMGYAQRLNIRYAKNYKVSTDALILWKNITNI